MVCRSTLIPALRNCSAPTWDHGHEVAVVGNREHRDRFAAITRGREIALHLVVIARAAQCLDPGVIGQEREFRDRINQFRRANIYGRCRPRLS